MTYLLVVARKGRAPRRYVGPFSTLDDALAYGHKHDLGDLGAGWNVENRVSPPHSHIGQGYCETCGHYGWDCTGDHKRATES